MKTELEEKMDMIEDNLKFCSRHKKRLCMGILDIEDLLCELTDEKRTIPTRLVRLQKRYEAALKELID